MTWKKPTSLWQWLLLLSPAVVTLAGPPIAMRILQPGHSYAYLNYFATALGIAALMCGALGCWLARTNPTLATKLVSALVCIVYLGVLNFCVVFGGCALIVGASGAFI